MGRSALFSEFCKRLHGNLISDNALRVIATHLSLSVSKLKRRPALRCMWSIAHTIFAGTGSLAAQQERMRAASSACSA